jgi:hypothetical protein
MNYSRRDSYSHRVRTEKLKESELLTPKEIIKAITVISDAVAFEELQSVFREWIQQLTWVIANAGVYFTK